MHAVTTATAWVWEIPASPHPQLLRPLTARSLALQLVPPEQRPLARVGQGHKREAQTDPPGQSWTWNSHLTQPQRCRTVPITPPRTRPSSRDGTSEQRPCHVPLEGPLGPLSVPVKRCLPSGGHQWVLFSPCSSWGQERGGQGTQEHA